MKTRSQWKSNGGNLQQIFCYYEVITNVNCFGAGVYHDKYGAKGEFIISKRLGRKVKRRHGKLKNLQKCFLALKTMRIVSVSDEVPIVNMQQFIFLTRFNLRYYIGEYKKKKKRKMRKRVLKKLQDKRRRKELVKRAKIRGKRSKRL